jgi:hypothetical protein
MKRGWWVVICIAIMAGVLVTFADYNNWRHAELDKYGQGWNDIKAPAAKLTTMYQNAGAKIRLRLPDNWKVEEEKPFLNSDTTRKIDPVSTTAQVVARINKVMTMKVWYASGDLTDIVSNEAKRVSDGGNRLSRDWEYANSEKINITVITWQTQSPDGKTEVVQEGLAKKGREVLKLVTEVPFEDWNNYENTVLEIYKNAEFL